MSYIDKIKQKIEILEIKLEKEETKLSKLTPTEPLTNHESNYNSKKKALIYKCFYSCSYCGEPIRKNSKKHKCGQIHDWRNIK